ncbi:MAG TPA: hypothetical protein VIV56_16885 [Gemmatimonadales bacterium]
MAARKTTTRSKVAKKMTARELATAPESATKPAPTPVVKFTVPDIRTVTMDIEGLSPLMVHAWSKKARDQLRNAGALGEPKTRRRPPRDPQGDFKGSLYHHPDGGYGFPAAAFKQAMVGACRHLDGLTMTQARTLFVVMGDLVKLQAPKPTMDERMVRVSNGMPDIRYRGVFWPWRTQIKIRYNAGAVSLEQLANLAVLAGEFIGVGELRPEKGAGSHGRFKIAP